MMGCSVIQIATDAKNVWIMTIVLAHTSVPVMAGVNNAWRIVTVLRVRHCAVRDIVLHVKMIKIVPVTIHAVLTRITDVMHALVMMIVRAHWHHFASAMPAKPVVLILTVQKMFLHAHLDSVFSVL
mmetsp:Transcript_7325/g.14684  ORF Transcript_7325/g.14684 Transcript_7325/m.14684 type:complete len:126 (-) Transcript_7325:411-788(-)